MFSFAVDWMHCVSLGYVKYVMTLLTQDKPDHISLELLVG